MNTIDPSFKESSFDPSNVLLKALPPHFNDEELDSLKTFYVDTLSKVENQLSVKVKSSYQQFVHAINDIQSLSNDLHECTQLCTEMKLDISNSKEHLAKNGVIVAHLFRRRQRYRQILDNLLRLQKFLKSRSEMEIAIKSGDFNKALSISLENKKIYNNLKEFKCIQNLSHTITDEMQWLKERLDNAVFSMFKSKFDPETFKSLLDTELLVGTPNDVIRRIKEQFKRSIETGSKRTIITSLLLNNKDSMSAYSLESKSFNKLCKKLKHYHFPTCLNLFFEQLCNYMFSYYKMLEWLRDYIQQKGKSDVYTEIYNSLLKYKRTIWERTIQVNIFTILEKINMESISHETYLDVLDRVRLFILAAEDFTGNPVYQLHELFTANSEKFFLLYHKEKMYFLKEFIESESWLSIDITNRFRINDIKELDSILCDVFPLKRRYNRKQHSFFANYEIEGNPFELKDHNSENLDFISVDEDKMESLDNEEEIIPDELLVDFVDEPGLSEERINEIQDSKKSDTQLLSSSTIEVLKLVGNYMKLMKLLEPVSHIIFEGLTQILKYYLHSLHTIFSPPLHELKYVPDNSIKSLILSTERDVIGETTQTTSSILRDLREKISSIKSRSANYITSNQGKETPNTPRSPLSLSTNKFGTHLDFKLQNIKVPTLVAKNLPFQTFVVHESIEFIRDCIMELKSTIRESLPTEQQMNMNNFFDLITNSTYHLSSMVLKNLALCTLDTKRILNDILSTNWDIQDMTVDASGYVSKLLKDVENFMQKLKVLIKVERISSKTSNEAIVQYTQSLMEILVDSYSKMRKISEEGRNLLMIDSQEIKMGLEKIIGIKKMNWAFLDNYIHCFHYPDEDLIQFIQTHTEYTPNQLKGLLDTNLWSPETKAKCLDIIEKRNHSQ